MKRAQWPFPGDAPVSRARKMGLAYRQMAIDAQKQLQAAAEFAAHLDPELRERFDKTVHLDVDQRVENVDRRFLSWGEKWHAERVEPYADDEMIDTRQVAALLCITISSASKLRMRGRLPARAHPDERGRVMWLYRAGDVYALANEPRPRKSTSPASDATDSIPASGTGDPRCTLE